MRRWRWRKNKIYKNSNDNITHGERESRETERKNRRSCHIVEPSNSSSSSSVVYRSEFSIEYGQQHKNISVMLSYLSHSRSYVDILYLKHRTTIQRHIATSVAETHRGSPTHIRTQYPTSFGPHSHSLTCTHRVTHIYMHEHRHTI